MSKISYSGIPTTTSPPSFITQAHSHTVNFIAKRRPWPLFFDHTAFSLPLTYQDAISRIKQNLNYFQVNYSMIMLLIIFLSLIYHPVSMIIFLVVFVLWVFCYFYRDTPVMVFNRVVDDRVVFVCLSLLTVFALAFTSVGMNVFVALVVVVVVVGLHSGFRCPDDLFLDEVDAVEGGLVSVVGSDNDGRSSLSYSLR
uniref:PRA1 family protein E-like n=1 Tax=Erigeron canadensis TaxID=72917 RepID=UPI001CB9514D|nr:PRA1 family protein E-like [Erigeron canadensis]